MVPSIKAEISHAAPDFSIEILCGVTMLGAKRRYRASDTVDGSFHIKEAEMGSSFGILNDERGCSTLGGSVTLSGGIRCGITNWHGVRDARLDDSEFSLSPNKIQADLHIFVSNTTNKALDIDIKTLANAPQVMPSDARPSRIPRSAPR